MPIDLINVPREITALAEWLFALVIIIFSRKRFKGWRLYGVIFGWLIFQAGYMVGTGYLPLGFWIPAMVGAVISITMLIYVTTDMNLSAATLFAAQSFVIAEFAASLEWQFYYFIFNDLVVGIPPIYIEYLFTIFAYSIIFSFVFLLQKRYSIKRYILDMKKNDMISMVTIAVMIFAISNLSFLDIHTPLTGRNPEEIFYIRTLVDLCGVILIYMHHEHHLSLHTKGELNALQNAFQKHYNQYMSSKENLDIINQRYHDLKHQIALIRAETDSEKRDQFLNEIERDITSYGVKTNTGNHVLDTILTSKSMVCVKQDITFTFVVDGKQLEFMNIVDLTSLFGNAIDNAIESVKTLGDKEKRLIKLTVYAQNQLLMIKFDNYYENTLKYEDGNLVTTKKESIYHGYGIKSIKSIAEKYRGTVTINTRNQWFTLYVLIPLEKQIDN